MTRGEKRSIWSKKEKTNYGQERKKKHMVKKGENKLRPGEKKEAYGHKKRKSSMTIQEKQQVWSQNNVE